MENEEFEYYLVSYDLNGGEGDFQLHYGCTVGFTHTVISDIPTKDHCNFMYWTDPATGKAYFAGDEYDGGMLVASWYEIPLGTITFDANGGTGDFPPISFYFGEWPTIPESVPEKEGCRFIGWVNQNENLFAPGSIYEVAEEINTLTAAWYEIPVGTITFDTNGGTGDFPPISFYFGEWPTIPESVPEKYRCEFYGWMGTYGNTFYPGDIYEYPNEQDTLSAMWSPELYVMTFDAAGGYYDYSVIKQPENTDFQFYQTHKEGHNFIHWVDEDGNTYVEGNWYIVQARDMTFTAVWERYAYSVKYEGISDSELVNIGNSHIITSGIPTKEGYDFVCWKYGDNTYNAGDTITPTEDIIFEAVWTPKHYTVTFDLNGGEGDFSPLDKTHDLSITLPASTPEREGFVFSHWADQNGAVYQLSEEYSCEGNNTLIAVWREIFTITYLNDDNSVFATQTKIEGEVINICENIPTKTDRHIFYRWYDKETFDMYSPGDELSKDGNIIFKIVWKKLYFVTFIDHNRRVIHIEEKSLGGKLVIPDITPEREGYTFVCWCSRTTGKYYCHGDIYCVNHDEGFDAVWIEDTKKTVTYDTNGGTGEFPEQSANKAAAITLHEAIPVREGYVFEGWCDKAEAINTEDDTSTYSLARTSGYQYSIFAPGYVYTDEGVLNLKASWRVSELAITDKPEDNTVNIEDLSYQLSVALPEEYKYFEVTWTSSDTSVARVDADGLIYTKGIGKTVITASVNITSNNTISDSFELTVDYIFRNSTLIQDVEVRKKALKRMANYYRKQALQDWIDEGNTCIFAFEGLGGTTGVVNDLHPGGFLKAMMIVTKGKEIVYVTRNASTLPDNRPDTIPGNDSTTTLNPGIYNYYVGDHGGYIALRQSEGSRPSWYINPKDNQKFYTSTAGGINIHATNKYPAGNTGPFSAGCQTVYWEDYVAFGQAVGFLDEDKKFESNLNPNSGLTSYMIDLVGSVTQHNSDKFPSTIKYILDREYDVNNGPSPEWGYGIFYPHNESGILEPEA